MSPKWLKRIWIFTALITLALVFATRQVINLSASSSTFSIGQTVYVVGSKKLTLLRDTASSSSRVAAIVEFGTLATVRDHKGASNYSWYFIDSAPGSGWIEEKNLSANAP